MSPLFPRRRAGSRSARPASRRVRFSLESLEKRELLTTAQDRLLASLQNNSNSQMVHQDAGNAVRYLTDVANQIRQVAADDNYALNQDINQAKQDRILAQEGGDTAAANADTAAIKADTSEKGAIAADVKQGNSFLSDADRQILGIANTETKQTYSDDSSVLRGKETPDQSTTNSDNQSTTNDQKIAADTGYDYSKAQVIDQEFTNFPPNFNSTNAAPAPAPLTTQPATVYMPATPTNFGGSGSTSGGGSSGGSTSGGTQRQGSPLTGTFTGSYTETRFVNGLTYHDSGTLTANFSAPASDLNAASLTGLQILDPNTGALKGTEGTINGNVESQVTGSGYSGAFRFIALDTNGMPGEIDINPWTATLSGNTLTGTYMNGTTMGSFSIKKQ